MAKTEPFDRHLAEYEQWFIEHRSVYLSELAAIRKVLPAAGIGTEVGVGSGLFAAELGIRDGIEPSPAMRQKAIERSIRAVDGVAEKLPYTAESYDFVLMVTTICFVDDVLKAFREVRRVLKNDGVFFTGFVDRESPLGRKYLETKEQNVFYRDADFYSTKEVYRYLAETGFSTVSTVQTVYGMLDTIKEIQEPRYGYGEGSFVVISAKKS